MSSLRIGLFCAALSIVPLKALSSVPDLPEAVTNNAVVSVHTEQGEYLVSFMGLDSRKDYKGVHNKVFSYKLGEQKWQQKSSVPSSLPLVGRLASIAVSVGDKAYLFGGYTVDKAHNEISSPDNFAYDPVSDSYRKLSPMPVSVDDAVALVYQDKYIYLISGWHNDGNVNLVQVYDIANDSWQQASPFLGQPVFGHAGGIVEQTIVICDGVKVVANADKRRGFAQETACFSGKIDSKNHLKIDWHTIAHPSGEGRYRMAALGHKQQIIFYGGSNNPYNYNGIGYNKVPSSPSNKVWRYSPGTGQWQVSEATITSMDHRALTWFDNKLLVVGGMGEKQTVLNKVQVLDAN